MKCEFCGKKRKIVPFIPRDKKSQPIFTKNIWFFAYVTCDCGTFIMDKEKIVGKKGMEEKQ